MPTTLGFVGTGKISSAVARGLIRFGEDVARVVVSPRNAEKAAQLQAEYPEMVTIAASNAEVVELADVVFVGLLPDVAVAELPALPFRDSQLVISMMATIPYEQLCGLIPGVPTANIVRTIPLPSNATGVGPILMYPVSEVHDALLAKIGTVVACKSEANMTPLVTIAGLISLFYQMQNTLHDFATSHGVDSSCSKAYIAAFHHALAQAAATSDDEATFEEFVVECATPGGLNEQALRELTDAGAFTAMRDTAENIYKRLSR